MIINNMFFVKILIVLLSFLHGWPVGVSILALILGVEFYNGANEYYSKYKNFKKFIEKK